jgi:hypothetical protein
MDFDRPYVMRSTLLISLFAIPGLAHAQSNKIDLFSFVMADAQLIAGANVDSAKNSTFGPFVLTQIPVGEKYLTVFMSETGIDPRSDVTELLAAWNGTATGGAQWLIGAHGNFSPSIETIEANALSNGGAITHLAGVDLVEAGNSTNPQAANLCIGLFTDGFTDVIGDCASVHAAVEPGPASSGAAASLATQGQLLRSQQDLWLVSVVPLTQFANLFAGANGGGMGNLGGVLKSNLFQAIQQVRAGVKFASAAPAGAQFSAGITMNSAQDATSLLNVVNFIVGLLKTSAGASPASSGIAALLGNLEASVSGSILNIGLNIPEATLEQLFQQIGELASTRVYSQGTLKIR